MINYQTSINGNTVTLAHPKATIVANKQGCMTYIEVLKGGRPVYNRTVPTTQAPSRLVELAQEYMK